MFWSITNLILSPDPDGTSCIASPPPQDFTISSNITQDGKPILDTCQPWRLNINGGQPPYIVVLDAQNSPVLTNVTIPPSDNALVYINRADPNIVLFGVYTTLSFHLDSYSYSSPQSQRPSSIGTPLRARTTLFINRFLGSLGRWATGTQFVTTGGE
jgi:hypothetical protein